LIAPGLTLYVIRHGQTQHNLEQRLTGNTHSPLTELGARQARQNGEILRRIEPSLEMLDFVASPILRARQSMELVREGAGLPQGDYRTDHRVTEIDVGTWAGISMAEAKDRMPKECAYYEADPWNYPRGGVESFAMVHARIKGFLGTLDRDTVVVCHFHPVRMFRSLALGMTPAETLAWRAENLGVLRITAGAADYFTD